MTMCVSAARRRWASRACRGGWGGVAMTVVFSRAPRRVSGRVAAGRVAASRVAASSVAAIIGGVVLAAAAARCAAADADAAVAGTNPPSLPRTVSIAMPHAYLRAGAGDDFYPTERLDRGTEVEIWAIDTAGWCAVRPVAGSFSWMRASDVTTESPLTDPQAPPFIGVVVTDGAIARVGSQLNPLRHVTQVALEAGERVQVVARVHVGTGRHAGEWLRIEPPAGEFRWAAAEDLALPAELAALVGSPDDPGGAGLAAAGEALAAIRDAGAAVHQAVAEMHEQPPADAAAPTPGLLPAAGATRLFGGWLPLGTAMFDTSTTAAPPTAVQGAVAQSADELADIDLALSLAVTGPSDQWNLGPLRERLRLAATRTTSESERMRAQAIDARLARFEEIQGRQQTLVAGPVPDPSPLRLGGMWSSLAALGSRPIRPGVLPGGSPAGGQPTWTPPDQVETTGRLATVISRRPDAPRWALVDERNQVLTFVTPQAGVNLAPLVGQQVTVRGARGYMPEYKRTYVVASDARTRIAAVPMPTGASDRTQ